MKKNTDCEKCYKVTCKSCGWEASDSEMEKIAKKELTACPICGWSPS